MKKVWNLSKGLLWFLRILMPFGIACAGIGFWGAYETDSTWLMLVNIFTFVLNSWLCYDFWFSYD